MEFAIKLSFNYLSKTFVLSLSEMSLNGEPSLQNTLELAGRVLKPLPGHASRELLVLFASLTTCDPGDINVTIQVRIENKTNIACQFFLLICLRKFLGLCIRDFLCSH